MTTKSEFILNEALTLSPEERPIIARGLNQSLQTAPDESDKEKWVELAQKRLEKLKAGNNQFPVRKKTLGHKRCLNWFLP